MRLYFTLQKFEVVFYFEENKSDCLLFKNEMNYWTMPINVTKEVEMIS